MSHLNDCECVACKYGPDELKRMEDESLAKYGWFAHYVGGLVDDDDSVRQNMVNFHTHGLSDTHNHLDFQVVLSIDPQVCHSIFWRLVKLIEEDGKTFEENELASDIIGNNYQVTFKKMREGNRDVLRIILPDSFGFLEEDCMDEVYRDQYA